MHVSFKDNYALGVQFLSGSFEEEANDGTILNYICPHKQIRLLPFRFITMHLNNPNI